MLYLLYTVITMTSKYDLLQKSNKTTKMELFYMHIQNFVKDGAKLNKYKN